MFLGRRDFEWGQTASLMSLVVNVAGGHATPADFLPASTQSRDEHVSVAEFKASFQRSFQ